MGRTGRPRTPTAVKLARGETRPSRVNRLEPQPRLGQPRVPPDMEPRAKTVWRQMLESAPPDLVTPYDAHVLRAFCEAVILYRDAHQLLRNSSLLVQHRDGLVKNPLHQVVRDHRDAIRLLARELGATPAARAGMVAGIGGAGEMADIDAVIGPPPRFRVVGGSDA